MIFSTSTRNRLKTSPRIAKMISALSWGVRILDKLFTSRFWVSRSLLNIDKSFSPLFWFSSSLLILDNSFSSKVWISSSLLIEDKSFSMEFWFLSSLLFCCGRQCSTFGPQPALRDWGYRQMHWKTTLKREHGMFLGPKPKSFGHRPANSSRFLSQFYIDVNWHVFNLSCVRKTTVVVLKENWGCLNNEHCHQSHSNPLSLFHIICWHNNQNALGKTYVLGHGSIHNSSMLRTYSLSY